MNPYHRAGQVDAGTVPDETFEIRVLGPFTVRWNGEELTSRPWPARVAGLFALLLTGAERSRTKDDILVTLWPDLDPKAAFGNLRYTLHVLRRLLGPRGRAAVLSSGSSVKLNPAFGWHTDLELFQKQLDSAGDSPEALKAALDLYSGEPLIDHRYDEWALPLRDRIMQKWRDGCTRLADRLADAEHYEEALRILRELFSSDPLDEQAVQSILRLCIARGDMVTGLRAYDTFRQHLRRELGLTPAQTTLQLAAHIRAEREADPETTSTSSPTAADASVARGADRATALVGEAQGHMAAAVRLYLAAGERYEEVAAHDAAGANFRDAVAVARWAQNPGLEADAFGHLGLALFAEGHLNEARAAFGAAAKVARSVPDVERQIWAEAQFGRTCWLQSPVDWREATRRMQPLLGVVSRLRSPSAAAFQTTLATLYFVRGEYGPAHESANGASRIARSVGRQKLLAEADLLRGASLCALGRRRTGLGILRHAAITAEELGDWHTLSRILGRLGDEAGRDGRRGDVRNYRLRAIEAAERAGTAIQLSITLVDAGCERLSAGDVNSASGYAARSVAALGPPRNWRAAALLARLAVVEGRPDDAEQMFEVVAVPDDGDAYLPRLLETRSLMAMHELAFGEPMRAIQHLESLVGREFGDGVTMDSDLLNRCYEAARRSVTRA
jgi:DNA-binding SARP family transcriptional activator